MFVVSSHFACWTIMEGENQKAENMRKLPEEKVNFQRSINLTKIYKILMHEKKPPAPSSGRSLLYYVLTTDTPSPSDIVITILKKQRLVNYAFRL